jgi:uncharacterized protein YxjI
LKRRIKINRKNILDKTKFLIEKRRLTPRPTYNVKDENGTLLGYYKAQMLKPDYWFEGIDGTRLGEVRSVGKRYEVYDTQNQLKATIRPASGQRWKSPWLIEDSEGRHLGEIKQTSRFLREYQILGQDGNAIAEIHPIINLPFYQAEKLLHTELTSCAEVWTPT